jgi:hypothetical protein
MKVYAVYFMNEKGVRYEGNCEIVYADDALVKVEVKMDMTAVQRSWFFSNLPVLETQLSYFRTPAMVQKVHLQNVMRNVPFLDFWNMYAYKVGKKARAETLWKQLNDEERTNCMIGVSRYKAWLYGKKIEMLYPETFLAQRRWESEY